ncbi:MAG TPA: prepilin-type N-terminal cleavage/methylation domain-containing protein [Phycisphaerae bacterium]|nr:prepilin-type N-terminal cleavage/methylation domain-containing protein [Phycisphaerae bacterium]HRR86429.1 prepilin-type N-terminal cleavage/methylation domain-containing protein [Phycisphaerae bacterium]
MTWVTAGRRYRSHNRGQVVRDRRAGARKGIKRAPNMSRAFTLIEVLVVISIIGYLIALLLPSLSNARELSRSAVCAHNQHQLAVAATAYTVANADWMNPIEDWWPSSTDPDRVEVTFRVILFPYAGRSQHVFDCPAERMYIYSDGFSQADEDRTRSLNGPTTSDRERYPYIYGIKHPLERWNFGGIGVAGVHWVGKKQAALPKSIPFGRAIESGYAEGLRKYAQVKVPSRLIWYGDGAGYDGVVAKYGDDLGWWIRPKAIDGTQCNPGFNRLADENYGCQRHNKKANYAFADGHVDRLSANDIPCNSSECWWSYVPGYHRLP